MGVGVSSLRLRKAVVLRAYNLRDGDQTLEEQFRKYAFRGDDGRLWIKLSDIKNGLSFTELSWADDMMKRVLGDSVNSDLVFSEFVEFLETGQAPSSLRGSSSLSALPSSSSSSSGEEMGMGSRSMSSIDQRKSKLSSTASPNKTPAPGRPTRPGLPPQPPRSSSSPSENDMNANVDRALSFAKAPEDDDDAMTTTTTTRSSTALTVLPNALGASPSSSVWRKRELVRQERTVQYTTIDANGTLQELVEKETSETEVLHMESRDTGEFAHRETTVYEQRETFNDEVVNEQHGEEEYVHLRSLEDEYEYMNSSGAVPGRGGGANDPQSEAPPISPRAHNEEYEGGGGGGGGAGGEEEGGDGRGFLDPSLAHYPGAEGGEQLDEETLAFLQMQELQRQYEEFQRAQAESGEAGGPVEGEYDDEDDEAGYPMDMPRSWTEPQTQPQTQTQTQSEPEPVEQEAEGPASQQQSLADID